MSLAARMESKAIFTKILGVQEGSSIVFSIVCFKHSFVFFVCASATLSRSGSHDGFLSFCATRCVAIKNGLICPMFTICKCMPHWHHENLKSVPMQNLSYCLQQNSCTVVPTRPRKTKYKTKQGLREM